jgi:hypothetical protein
VPLEALFLTLYEQFVFSQSIRSGWRQCWSIGDPWAHLNVTPARFREEDPGVPKNPHEWIDPKYLASTSNKSGTAGEKCECKKPPRWK